MTSAGSSASIRPDRNAAKPTAAAGSTARRKSAHKRSRAARISASLTNNDVTSGSSFSRANGIEPTRDAPNAEAATESISTSTGSPAASAAFSARQRSGSTA